MYGESFEQANFYNIVVTSSAGEGDLLRSASVTFDLTAVDCRPVQIDTEIDGVPNDTLATSVKEATPSTMTLTVTLPTDSLCNSDGEYTQEFTQELESGFMDHNYETNVFSASTDSNDKANGN